jgi:C-terminal processing protease CtpA/Prc
MRLIHLAVLLLPLGVPPVSGLDSPPPQTSSPNEEDFGFLWNQIESSYAYFDKKSTDWAKVKALYRTRFKEATTRDAFIALLESVLEELYDHHAHLNTNTDTSPRLVPSGTDVWAGWRNDRAIITQVRPGSNAERAGMKAGMEVVSIDGVAVVKAVAERLGKSLRAPDHAARDWALRAVLAGRQNQDQRRVGIRSDLDHPEGIAIEYGKPRHPQGASDRRLLEHRRMNEDESIGYIRIKNSLGSIELIREFDAALGEFKNSAGLILDLRDTPSGGNSTVARGIMGRFIGSEGFYQKHSIPEEEQSFGVKRSWVEIVSPRGDFAYTAPVVVLVDHWTGSMGEGIAIGMDGLKRATVVGTEMAGLLGATSAITLPNSKIGVNFPVEKLFHVSGTPREGFVPPVYVDLLEPENAKAQDAVLKTGLKTLRAFVAKGTTK